jgi:hypothetical protein
VYVEVYCDILSFYWYLTLACHMATGTWLEWM